MARRTFAVLASIFLILGQALGASAAGNRAGPAAQQVAAPIAAGLIDELRSGARSSFVVEFRATTDLRGARQIHDKAAKGRFVYDNLRKTAATSQKDALALAKGVKGVTATGYWLTNVVVVEANFARGHRPDRVTAARVADLAEKLARVAGVTGIRAEGVYEVIEPVKGGPGIAAIEPEWGVEKIRAPEVWDEGITGSGVVVGSIDTGVEYTHEALVEHYRGNLGGGTFDHNYNWWDPSGVCPEAAPCDNVFHGTHTMGTIVGGDLDGPLPDIGVAPGATWITAKGCEDFGCSESALLSSGQFMVAPTDLDGNNADPSKAPDLVSNSWGNDDPNNLFYLETVQAWRAAGIIPVFAAGNAGPGCGSAGTPGNYVESLSVGATDIDDNIAGFSSRGPSPTDKISPNLSAPGVDVLSAVPGNGYDFVSGTSMATPHVAGAIALMISAETALAGDFDGILNALNITAVDRPDDQCGAPEEDLDPNFVYGEGRIDAKAAVDLVKNGGTLVGTITDADSGDPIAGAKVTASDGERDFSTTTGPDGTYDLFLAEGTYTVSAEAFGYEVAVVFGTVIVADQETTENLALTPLPRFTVSGTVSGTDGNPIADASVIALGTPVAPATTDAAGQYALILPIGEYALQATLGGCTDTAFAVVNSIGDDVVQDFTLSRKLDNFGHGCQPIGFDWVDAQHETALQLDNFGGRLRLPFSFPFYGESYDQVLISDNGLVSFVAPPIESSFPVAIPNPDHPNAAIYALWQDMYLDWEDLDSHIDYDTVGTGDDTAFVLEFNGVRTFGSTNAIDFEIKLWADGTIDLLYGDNPRNPGDGRNATVGIENAAGNDALQIGFFEQVIEANSAIRIEELPVGILTGTVTDANDGAPIAGATINAEPGNRVTMTNGDGQYELRLLAGTYDVTASMGTYEPATSPLTIATGESAVLDFALNAATASVDPTSIEATVGLGETAEATVRLSNNGSSMLDWEAKERESGFIPPDLPPALAGVFRTPTWSRVHLPNEATVAPTRPFDVGGLPLVIDDADDDSFDSNEITAVHGQSGTDQVNIAINFANLPLDELGGYMYLDIDQDPNTGLPAEALFGLPSQDVGLEYFVTFFDLAFTGEIPVWNEFGDLVGIVQGSFDGETVAFGVPLEMLGGDDGTMNIDMVAGFTGPSDWAADEGHGTVTAFSEVPWLDESPASGTIGAGGFQDVVITLGDPSIGPGEYHGQVVFVTSAPKQPQVAVDVTLTVTLPEEFGRAAGTITDAHTGAPIDGATVVVHTTWLGEPLDFTTTTAGDGTWAVIGPEGTWPVDVSAPSYVSTSIEATIVRGVTTGGADAALHFVQPHSVIEGGPFTFVLTPGRTGTATINISNPGGHADLEIELKERSIGAAVAGHAAPTGAAPTGLNSRTAPAGYVATKVAPSAIGGPSLVLMDALPWGSDAIQQVLAANGVTFDELGSGDLDSVDLNQYQVIYVGNDQSQAFYDAVAANIDKFAGFVAAGGYLWFGSASFGFSDGSLDGFVLPGGLSIHGPTFEDFNDIAAPDHPVVAGMPNPFAGNFASHTTMADLPPGATVIATGTNSGDPTLVEYAFGSGRILTVGQPVEFFWANGGDAAMILENGVPYTQAFIPFSDVPWLSESPETATVAPDGSLDVEITVDTTDLEPGVYQAAVIVLTNDPDQPAVEIPVTVVVPAYQQGINSGGSAYTNANGDVYAADKAFSSGSYGWVGASSTRSTGAPIAGTSDQDLFRNLRTGMTAYRFAVPDGTYRVDLAFAELQARHAGDRVFSVSLEGGVVLSNFDVFGEAGGMRSALDRTFLVEVTDGVLDISFLAQRGDAPIVNAILVTELPEGAP